jgi:formylglycine-generating enzyme required for sulfatase activity
VYAFAHLTFQEYLAARVLADDANAETLVQSKLGDPWRREALFLGPGSTESKRRASQLIRAMMEAKAQGGRHEHLVLAAECVLDVGEVRVEGDLLGDIKRRLQREAEAPEPARENQRRGWLLRRIAALNALSRIESGHLSGAAGSRYWKPDTGEPDWVTIPAGEFWMGSDERDKEAFDNERPARRIELDEYQIARVPITNAQYALFVTEANVDPPGHWRGRQPPKGEEDHPVVNVSWHDAQAYGRWLTEKIGRAVRLPTEAEWEKAARGDRDGRRYPWGDEWGELMCNSGELGLDDTSPVGLFLSGASPYGALDIAGNVWEWCQSKYKPYPYDADDGREDLKGDGRRVLRGGSFDDGRRLVRCAFRRYLHPGDRFVSLGYRVVVVSPGPRAARPRGRCAERRISPA